MLEGVLEQLLLQYLTPYVSGISRENLKIGVLSGALELNDLGVEKDALAKLGMKDYRVRTGSIGSIKLSVPWRQLYTGKLRASIEGLKLEIESIAGDLTPEAQERLIAEIRSAKQKTIEARMHQLADLLEQEDDARQDAAGASVVSGRKRGTGVRLVRKILHNITITLSDVELTYINHHREKKHRGFACVLAFPELAVLSTDETFRERGEKEEVVASGTSMYKLIRLQDLSLKMAPAGSSDRAEAEYVLSPLSASVKLSHLPSQSFVGVLIEVATEELAEIVLHRSKVKHIRRVRGEVSQERQQLEAFIVSPEQERAIFMDPAQSRDEYSKLYERQLLWQWEQNGEAVESLGAVRPLNQEELSRMQLYEDAFSPRVLAVARLKVHKRLQALNEEMVRRQLGHEKRGLEEKAGFFSRFLRSRNCETRDSDGSDDVFTTEERRQFELDIEDDTKVEGVDAPSCFKFEFKLGKLALDLVDDRMRDELNRQLMSLALKDANMTFQVDSSTDHRGKDSAQWCMELSVGAFHAFHRTQALFTFAPPAEERWKANIDVIMPLVDSISSAARLTIQSKLMADMNLLFLAFDFAPVQIHMLPGVAEYVLEFWRSPIPKQEAPEPEKMDDAGLRREAVMEVAKNVAHNYKDTVQFVGEKVYERLPDKIQMKVNIASPILHVPVQQLGTAVLSLGELKLDIEPCEYRSIDMVVVLDHTAIMAFSTRGDRFDMVHPVPVRVNLEYRLVESSFVTDKQDEADEDVIVQVRENQVTVQVQVEEMTLTLSPQAMQILLFTPGAMMSIMWPPAEPNPEAEQPEEPVHAESPSMPVDLPPRRTTIDMLTPRRTIVERIQSMSVADIEGDLALSRVQNLTDRAANFAKVAKEVLPEQIIGTDSADLIRGLEKKYKEATKQFRLNLGVQWKSLDVTLSDSIVPVIRLRFELMQPGLVMYQQRDPYTMRLWINNCAMALDVLNRQNGSWEPLAERFELSFEVERKQADANRRASHITISGKETLLLNFTPTMFRRAGEILPLFVRSVTSSDLVETPQLDMENLAVSHCGKYRVLSLCDGPMELSFKARHGETLHTTIYPTGSNAESLDRWVLRHYVTAIAVKQKGKELSDWLPLERVGAIGIPKTNYMAELMTPGPTHRLLVLATPLRVHNQTDLPLHVKFFNEARELVRLQPTGCCNATLLGETKPNYAVHSNLKDSANSIQHGGGDFMEGILKPNAICSVPHEALFRARVDSSPGTPPLGVAPPPRGRANGRLITWLSVKPAGVAVEDSVKQHAGEHVDACTIKCIASYSAGGESAGDVHFVCASRTHEQVWPLPTHLTTVTLQPTLALLNALPVGELEVKYSSVRHKGVSHEIIVPRFSRLNIYSFPTALSNGIMLQARLGKEAHWSEQLTFWKDAINQSDNTQTVGVGLTKKGATAAVTVEPLDNVALRLSCPNWFIDRSGLQSDIEVQYHDGYLPREDCITLLPAEVLEQPCALVLPTDTDAKQVVRFPPSWTVFPWSTGPSLSYVFCVQNDDIASSDVLGAQCQVMTLRPRLVLTNASGVDLQINHGEAYFILPENTSKALHWKVNKGEEEHPTTSLRFRPVQIPECGWSGKVYCADDVAGSTPFALPIHDPSATKRSGMRRSSVMGSEIWSVEVAPVRGALAVTFKQGSEFVAVNRCEKSGVSMFIRPCGCDDSVLNVPVPLGGEQEVPFGWMHPFEKQQRRAVEVILDNSIRLTIPDVRRAIEITSNTLHVVVVVSRVGARTLVAAKDCGEAAFDVPTKAGTTPAVLLQFDIRLSKLGVSLVDETSLVNGILSPAEILYLHFDLIRFTFQKNNLDVRSFKLAISEAQVDCQLPGRVDANTTDSRRHKSLVLLGHERPAVILANCAAGDRAFLTFMMQQSASGSRDILLHKAEIALDALDVTIDDYWLDPLVNWLHKTTAKDGPDSGVKFRQIQDSAGVDILKDYTPPQLPKVIQIDEMQVGAVSFTVWCALKLKTVRFLPQYVRTAMRVLSLSGDFMLDGAHFFLPTRTFPPHRGSLKDFVKGLVQEYTTYLINNAAAFLGKSSLLNLPRVPLRFGSSIVSYLTDSLGLAAGEVASLMAHLTFDDDYIKRQRQIREEKKIKGFSDGVAEAGKSLVQGFEGFADIWRKPVEGAQKDGIAGLMSGIGRGVAGTVVKPIEKLGQAISDVGSGIAAQVAPDSSASKRRRARERMRLPRLFTQRGAIRPWSEFEAETLNQVGAEAMAGVVEVLPLTPDEGRVRLVMLLFSDHISIYRIEMKDHREGRGGRGSRGRVARVPEGETNGASLDVDVFEAIDESASKLWLQVLKPINTLKYGVEDMEAQLVGKFQNTAGDAEPGRPGPLKNSHELYFQDLRDVSLCDKELKLTDLHNVTHKLPLGGAPFGSDTCKALARGFEIALTNASHMANWEDLHNALAAEVWGLHVRHEDGSRTPHGRKGTTPNKANRSVLTRRNSGAGQRILEVFEVERRLLPGSPIWKTPFLFTDREFCWRWVDRAGLRHPHLFTDFSQKQCAEAAAPPCELRELFVAKSRWEWEVGNDTDAFGWQYGLAWNNSTWEPKPSFFDAIRKRRWTRNYG